VSSRRTKSSTVGWTGRLVPVANRPRYELQRTVDALNGKLPCEQVLGPDDALVQERRFKQTPPLLRRLVQAWLLSGPDLGKFSFDQRQMWADVDRYWKSATRLNPLRIVGAPGGGAAFFLNCCPEPDPYDEALRWFTELLFNPECNRLAGPCPRCGNYYIRRSARNKVYCSRSCGTRATALAATRERRDEEHADKLRRAAQAAREWTIARTKKEWKPWVSGRHPDITPKFLTRAVNKRELEPPTKGKKP
jgi:hypothetical protein